MRELRDRLQQVLGDRYRVERELGSGGMGVVFLAADLKLGRSVAIKVLRPEIAQAVGDERFLREIHISAQLSHPHILPLIDSGSADGLLYYVMFYVSGETLRSRLDRESQLPVDEAVRIGREIAKALDHAHGQGVVHRDIKPENILLDDGHALVCDFGIARAVGEAGGRQLTQTGFVVGTPAYMSPEQGTGETTVDHRSDIYALGCVVYEMLIGSPPFGGAAPHVLLARKCVEQVPGLRTVRAAIPVHVEEAVLKTLASTPADRFQSAGAFGEALTDAEATARTRRRHHWETGARRAAVATAAVAAVAVAVALLWSRGRGGGGGALRVRSAQVTALPGLEDSPSFSPDGQWLVYAGDNGADRDIYLRSLTGERAIDLTEGTPGDDYSPAFSPDGQQIAFRSTRAGGGLFVMGRTGEATRRVSEQGEDPAWAPDGRSLVYAQEHVGVNPFNLEPGKRERGLWTVDLETGATRQLVDGDAVLPAWSPNGRWIAYTSRSAESRPHLWLVPAGGGDPVPLSEGTGDDWGSAWSPDSRFLYFSSNRAGSMNLWRMAVDPASGRARGAPEPLPTPSVVAAHPSVSGDGTRILYASVLTTQNVERARFDSRADTLLEPFLLTTGTRQWSSPDPSPDGSLVAFYSRDLPEGDLYVVRRDGTGLRQLTADSAIDRVPRWSPDGTRIAYFSNRSGRLTAWVIDADGSHNRQLTFTTTTSAPGAWSPDGRRMAIVRSPPESGFLLDLSRPWDDQTPEPLIRDTASGHFVSNDWSPDGTRLAGMRSYSDQGVGYYELATGRQVLLTDFGQWPVWMPDSRHLLFVSGGHAFYLVDARTRHVRPVYSTVRDMLGPPRVTADGREVVYSRRHTEGDIWLVTLESGSR